MSLLVQYNNDPATMETPCATARNYFIVADQRISDLQAEVDRLIDREDELIEDWQKMKSEVERLMDALDTAWGIIANAESWVSNKEWKEAMFRWRDNDWHPALDRNGHPGKAKAERQEVGG
jgi:hypothetical protein